MLSKFVKNQINQYVLSQRLKKFNEKKVWQLNQLPYDKEELGVVVGILIKDKEDIVKSL